MDLPSVTLDDEATELLMHISEILDHVSACWFTHVVILEQHKQSQVLRAMAHYSVPYTVSSVALIHNGFPQGLIIIFLTSAYVLLMTIYGSGSRQMACT